ncbi:hypothetical protein QUF90_14815 [Desulfococcaceae bacterium HSG9]|nr:hypothetical protein [Desulfococcaceae bacterium HSG9]
MPAGVTLGSVTSSAGGAYASSSWTIASLAGGDSETLTITGTVNDPLLLTNIAEVTAATGRDVDSTPGNGYSTPETEGEDDWAIVRPNMGLITGKVLDDRDGFTPDTFDAGDDPISDVRIELWSDLDGNGDLSDGALVDWIDTDSTGVYNFYAPAGDYVVVEIDPVGYISIRDLESMDPATGAITGDTTAPSYIQTADNGYNEIPVTVVAGEEYYENNFLDLEPWVISGYVTTMILVTVY